MEDLCSETLAVTRRPLRTNLFRPSLLPAFWIFFFFFLSLSFLFFFFFPFLSFSLTSMHTHTHTRRLSRTHVHACTHTQSPAQLFMGSGQGSRGGKTGGVRSRPPSPPHPTPPHPTPLHVNLRALWSVLESSDLRAGQRQRNALPLPPFLSL